MPAQHNLRKRPSCHLTADGDWPDGPLEDNPPGEARLALALSRRLKQALQGRSNRAVAKAAKLDRRTILQLVNGYSWGRVPTIARLEKALGVQLWGDEHLRPVPRTHINSGEWPDGQLSTEAPPEARLVQALVVRLQQACGSRNLKEVAKTAQVSVHTLGDLINGTFWGDLTTIARLERVVSTRLWGDEHRWTRRPRDYLSIGVWPDGRLADNAPPKARLAQGVVHRIHIVCSKSSLEAVALEAGIKPTIVQDILDGTIWPDFAVIARLEKATGITLWGGEHFGPVRYRTIKETIKDQKREDQRRRY